MNHCAVGVCSSPVHCQEIGRCFSAPTPDAEPLTILRELVALKRLHDKIEAAEAKGTDNFIDGVPLPMAKDEYARRKAAAWAKAFEAADAP